MVRSWETVCCHGFCWVRCDLLLQYHCIVLTACCLPTLSVDVSPAHLFREEVAVIEPQWFFHLEWLLLGVYHWGVDPSRARLETIQTLSEVWFGTGRGNFAMPFSSLYLLKWPFLLSSVNSRYSARLDHYSAASRGFPLGELFLDNLESFQILQSKMADHCHYGHSQVCHVFERYPPWLLWRVMFLSFSTR